MKIGGYTSALETTWSTEVVRFGWAAPPKDPRLKVPGGRYLVRIENLGTRLYGYVTSTAVGDNPHTPWDDRDAVGSCMVLNQNFVPFPGTPQNAMRATVAHEFNHSLQFGYGALTGPTHVKGSWVEGGATWMEDEVFDGSNDNYNYLWPDLRKPMPLFDPRFPYPYWVVFRAMTEPFGGSGAPWRPTDLPLLLGGAEQECHHQQRRVQPGVPRRVLELAAAYHDAGIALRFPIPCGGDPRALLPGGGYRVPGRRRPERRRGLRVLDAVPFRSPTTSPRTGSAWQHPHPPRDGRGRA